MKTELARTYGAARRRRHTGSDKWETPPDLFAELAKVFRFTLDACASAETAKCRRFYTEADDALSQKWSGVVWMNPPYGKALPLFVRKAYEASRGGATVVCLLPVRTDARWWHDYVSLGTTFFLPGRLRFLPGAMRAPFASVIVVFFGGALG